MKHKKQLTEAELVRSAKSGDREAMAAIYEATYPELWRTVRAMVKNGEDVNDILQDSYLKAFSKLELLEDEAALRPWLRQIAANTARDQLRRSKPLLFSELTEEEAAPLPELPEQDERALPEQALEQKERARLVRELLEALSDGQRLILGLYYYEDLSVRQIAETLEISENTVKSQLWAGRKRIESRVRELERQGFSLGGLASQALFRRLLQEELGQAPVHVPAQTPLAIAAEGASALKGGTVHAVSAASHILQRVLAAGAAALLLSGVGWGVFRLAQRRDPGPGPAPSQAAETQSEIPPEPTEPASARPRGVITEDRYQNEFFGLRYTLPEGCAFRDPAELAEAGDQLDLEVYDQEQPQDWVLRIEIRELRADPDVGSAADYFAADEAQTRADLQAQLIALRAYEPGRRILDGRACDSVELQMADGAIYYFGTMTGVLRAPWIAVISARGRSPSAPKQLLDRFSWLEPRELLPIPAMNARVGSPILEEACELVPAPTDSGSRTLSVNYTDMEQGIDVTRRYDLADTTPGETEPEIRLLRDCGLWSSLSWQSEPVTDAADREFLLSILRDTEFSPTEEETHGDYTLWLVIGEERCGIFPDDTVVCDRGTGRCDYLRASAIAWKYANRSEIGQDGISLELRGLSALSFMADDGSVQTRRPDPACYKLCLSAPELHLDLDLEAAQQLLSHILGQRDGLELSLLPTPFDWFPTGTPICMTEYLTEENSGFPRGTLRLWLYPDGTLACLSKQSYFYNVNLWQLETITPDWSRLCVIRNAFDWNELIAALECYSDS